MEAYRFDPEAVRDRLVQLIRETAAKQGFSRVVVGISGGKDSTVTAALCARALGKENVYGVMLPDGEQKDISDSRAVCDALGMSRSNITKWKEGRSPKLDTVIQISEHLGVSLMKLVPKKVSDD